jgi:recombinational DNA repair protein (RecF pathway)
VPTRSSNEAQLQNISIVAVALFANLASLRRLTQAELTPQNLARS